MSESRKSVVLAVVSHLVSRSQDRCLQDLLSLAVRCVLQVNGRHSSMPLSPDLSSSPVQFQLFLRTMSQLAARAIDESSCMQASASAGVPRTAPSPTMSSTFVARFPRYIEPRLMLTAVLCQFVPHGVLAADAPEGGVLAKGRYISGLLAACGDDLLPFVQLYHRLLSAAPAGRSQLVSAMAFGCSALLPRLWRCAVCSSRNTSAHTGHGAAPVSEAQ